MNGHVDIVVAPGALTDRRTADDLVARALEARGLTGGIVDASDSTGEVIVVPGLGNPVDSRYERAVRVDFGPCPADRSAGVRAHIRGRGLAGLRYAIDSVYFHRVHPATVVSYGDHADHRVELRTPEGDGPFPVAVLLHGGYWRSRWEFDLMDAVAVDLTSRGYATWNVEYRRPDEHGWDATRNDVAAAYSAVFDHLDPSRIVVLGHSAGGQLALRLAADAARPPELAVSLAGVLDLRLADERWLGEGAVSNAIGGRYADAPEVYDASSPRSRLPLGVPQVVVCADGDDPNLVEISRDYYAAADLARWIDGPGGHFDVIDPGSEIWSRIVEALDS